MAKKTCDCCRAPKPDLKEKAWGGRPLALCATCSKTGKAKVLVRIASASEAPRAEAPKRNGKEPKPPRVSIGGTIRELHAAGKTNAEIWAVVQPQFSMPDTKKWYVSWYIWDAKRKENA
jgi:hypothetical protein